MIRILAIGNSFSEDATCYLHGIAQAAGVEMQVLNLYIGGCPLEKHWRNIEEQAELYQYQENGVLTDRYGSIEEALEQEKWDFIVTQQASHDSGWINTYEPFLGWITQWLQKKAPQAKLCLHETWAYEIDSDHWGFARYERSQQKMYDRLRECYHSMAEKYDLELIQSGDIIQQMRGMEAFHVPSGGMSLCRDGFHMSFVYGRYLLACIWAKKLLGVSLKENAFVPVSAFTDEQADPEMLAKIREIVDSYDMAGV